MAPEVVKLDPADIAGGRVEFGSFPAKLEAFNVQTYAGKHVQLEGCSPTWAHLLVAGKLVPHVAALDFVIDDGKEGKVVEVYRK